MNTAQRVGLPDVDSMLGRTAPLPPVAITNLCHGQTLSDVKAGHKRNKREPIEMAWWEHIYTELAWARWRVDDAGAYCEALASCGTFAYRVTFTEVDGKREYHCNCLAQGKGVSKCRHIHHAQIVAKYPESKPWILPERSLIELVRAA